jgi:protein AFG1
MICTKMGFKEATSCRLFQYSRITVKSFNSTLASITVLQTRAWAITISCKTSHCHSIKMLIMSFHSDENPDTEFNVDTIFKILCSQENDIIRPKTFTHFGRNLSFQKTCGQVLDTTFNEICSRELGASDYIQLAQYFHTIIIRYVPQLNLKKKSATRRFITLIDSLYDNRVRVSMNNDDGLWMKC